MSKQVFELNFAGRNLSVEVGELAKQANGAAMIRYDDTAVLSVVASSKEPSKLDFFPLMVVFQEKLYAAGKIPGGFLKREGRPSDFATLTSRLIDRPIRPLFPKGFKYDVQIINSVMSNDVNAPADFVAMLGSSIALVISDLPFMGPIAGVNVGLIDGEFIVNPTVAQKAVSEIELTVAGTKDAINMVEAGAKEASEEVMLKAILFAHEQIKTLCEFQETIIAAVKPSKIEPILDTVCETIEKDIVSSTTEKMTKAIQVYDKHEREDNIKVVKEEVLATYEAKEYATEEEKKSSISDAKRILDSIVKKEVRRLITEEKVRPDGRACAEIRPLDSQIDILQRTHGSALFTRGQTQALSITTLGSLSEYQVIDNLTEEEQKRFMLHYNFPSFSVGETGRYGAPGRREVGHGALGERALLQVMPNEEEFPYTIRVVSEILESNGSTSQASICAATMSLMAAGVPLKSPVAGIAMGLIMDAPEKYSVLSDIQGMEDHLGDMDFKVAGTAKGITALQMDIKMDGLNPKILEEALEQAKIGRLHILENMVACIPAPRTEVTKWAPKVKMMKISPDKIRAVIGAGGKVITDIIERSNDVKIDIDDNGQVTIQHQDIESINKAVALIENIIKEAKVGEIFETAKVVRVEAFGAFVNLWDGQDALLHVSQIAHERVEKVEDVIKLNDVLKVKVTEIDDKGRVKVSRKALLPRLEKKKVTETENSVPKK